MGLFLEDLNKYPECTTNIKDIKLEDNQIISFITVNLDEHRKKYEKLSISFFIKQKTD